MPALTNGTPLSVCRFVCQADERLFNPPLFRADKVLSNLAVPLQRQPLWDKLIEDMTSDTFGSSPNIGVAVRTLLVAGFSIQGSHTQPRHIEIQCERHDVLGATLKYLVAITEQAKLRQDEVEAIHASAKRQARTPVIIAGTIGSDWISWNDFLEGLGGAVPSWTALGPTFDKAIFAASRNFLPEDATGDAWVVFEDLVASGLEFIFGRRVRRLGGRKRGKPVSDMQAQTPSDEILVVDAKAYRRGFDASLPNLRPLGEYVERQRCRQSGQFAVSGALVVSSEFLQNERRLADISARFFADRRLPVTFMTAEQLIRCVALFRGDPVARNAVRWNTLFRGGAFPIEELEEEEVDIKAEQYRRGG